MEVQQQGGREGARRPGSVRGSDAAQHAGRGVGRVVAERVGVAPCAARGKQGGASDAASYGGRSAGHVEGAHARRRQAAGRDVSSGESDADGVHEPSLGNLEEKYDGIFKISRLAFKRCYASQIWM